MTQDTQPARPDDERGPVAAEARWIVSEHTGRWAIGLRREAGPRGMRLYETRSLADGWSMLEQHPFSFLVAELTHANAPALVKRIAETERTCPLARVAVVAERWLAEYQWLAREAGAVWFATSPRALQPIVEIASRHLKLAPRAHVSLVQQIWSSMPWAGLGRDRSFLTTGHTHGRKPLE